MLLGLSQGILGKTTDTCGTVLFPSSGKNPAFIVMAHGPDAVKHAPYGETAINLDPVELTADLLRLRTVGIRVREKGDMRRSGIPAPYRLSAESPSSSRSIGSLP